MKTNLTFLSILSLLLFYSCDTTVEKEIVELVDTVFVNGLEQVHVPEEGKGSLIIYFDNTEQFPDSHDCYMVLDVSNSIRYSELEDNREPYKIDYFDFMKQVGEYQSYTYYTDNTYKPSNVYVYENLLPGTYLLFSYLTTNDSILDYHTVDEVTYGIVEIKEGEIATSIVKWFTGKYQDSYIDYRELNY